MVSDKIGPTRGEPSRSFEEGFAVCYGRMEFERLAGMTMQLWIPHPEYLPNRFTNAFLSRQPGKRDQWNSEEWSPGVHIFFANRGTRLSQDVIEKLRSYQFQVHLGRGSKRNIAGIWSAVPSEFMAVSEPARQAIEDLDPGAFQFISYPEFFDWGSKKMVSDAPFHIAWPLRLVDALNLELSDLNPQHAKARGFYPRQLKGLRTVYDRDRLPDGHFFRCSQTGNALCTTDMRDTIERLKFGAWFYAPVELR